MSLTLTVDGDRITDSNGQPLDGDGNGFTGGDSVTSFYRLYGDVNGDRVVNLVDMTAFRGTFGTAAGGPGFLDYLDSDGDGVMSLIDLTVFRNHFGMILLP